MRTSASSVQRARPAAALPQEPDANVRRLGEQLLAQTDEVVSRTVARIRESGVALSDGVEQRFERVGEVSTIAVAKWMAGEDPAVAIEVGQEVWQIFGQLAAQRAAPLNEVTKRCWRWSDAASDVLRETALRLKLPNQALSQALQMLELSLRLTLVQMCECFDAERQRADEELNRRQKALSFMATHDALTGLPNVLEHRTGDFLPIDLEDRSIYAGARVARGDEDVLRAVENLSGQQAAADRARARAYPIVTAPNSRFSSA